MGCITLAQQHKVAHAQVQVLSEGTLPSLSIPNGNETSLIGLCIVYVACQPAGTLASFVVLGMHAWVQNFKALIHATWLSQRITAFVFRIKLVMFLVSLTPPAVICHQK